jgi:hypothetical protein
VSFFSAIFLWAFVSLSIPIAIALWNRKKFKKEIFGAYFLLKKFSRVSQRRIRLLELIKLINRLCFLGLLILIFAQPLQKQMTLSEAENGFAIYVDVSRDLQSLGASGRPATEILWNELTDLLDQIPPSSQGMLAFVSDRCDFFRFSGQSMTGRAREIQEALSLQSLPFSGRRIRTEALQQCYLRANSLFSDREILHLLISPLSEALDLSFLQRSEFSVRQIEIEKPTASPKIRISQEADGDSTSLQFDGQVDDKLLNLISRRGEVSSLGIVPGEVQVANNSAQWLWIQNQGSSDPFLGQQVLELARSQTEEVVLWAEQQSEGLQSLYSALRNHPEIDVRLVVGGEPKGSNLIVYGPSSIIQPEAQRLWYFLSPDKASSFPQRDQKQWIPTGNLSGDLRRSFTIEQPDTDIFVRRYLILSLDGLESLESFQDGAPSLLQQRDSDRRIWITPFDLEDLTTDLVLEASFIPYLYRKVEDWFERADLGQEEDQWENIWAMPGRLAPNANSLEARSWPGIYQAETGVFQVVEADDPSEVFSSWNEEEIEGSVKEESVPLRTEFFPYLLASLFLELLLCAVFGRGRLLFGLLLFFSVQNSVLAQNLFLDPLPSESPTLVREIQIGVLPGMDSDRQLALNQIFQDVKGMANLDIKPAQAVSWDGLWNYSAIFHSTRADWTLKNQQQRERLRYYLERGGLLIFDDPLAERNTRFRRSVGEELAQIFPGRDLERLDREHVIYRSFYLLKEVSGRRLAQPYLEGIQLDGRWVVIFSSNDLLGATLRSNLGDYALSVSPYGPVQRSLSQRLLINMLMYSVTGDYKDDAIHLPHILQRRAR